MYTRADCITLIKLKGSPDPERSPSDFLAGRILHYNFVDTFPEGRFGDWYTRDYKELVIQYKRRDERFARVSRDNASIGQLKWYFITIGYDDRIITPLIMKKMGDIISSKDYFNDVIYVHEKHRRDGSGNIYTHHHTHFLVVCDLPKTRIIDRIYATVKKYVSSKNFVDVKSYKDNVGTYEQKVNYIEGNKVSEKMECVELDDIWRKENGLFRKL